MYININVGKDNTPIKVYINKDKVKNHSEYFKCLLDNDFEDSKLNEIKLSYFDDIDNDFFKLYILNVLNKNNIEFLDKYVIETFHALDYFRAYKLLEIHKKNTINYLNKISLNKINNICYDEINNIILLYAYEYITDKDIKFSTIFINKYGLKNIDIEKIYKNIEFLLDEEKYDIYLNIHKTLDKLTDEINNKLVETYKLSKYLSINSLEVFKHNIIKKSQGFIKNDFDWTGVTLAGGYILSCLLKRKINSSDIDLWIYDREDFIRCIKYFKNYKMYWSDCIVNIVSKKTDMKIQLIHTGYENPYNIIIGFDFDCVEIFYNGDNLYSTIDNIISLKDNCIYNIKLIKIERINKYISKGFKIYHEEVIKNMLNKNSSLSSKPLLILKTFNTISDLDLKLELKSIPLHSKSKYTLESDFNAKLKSDLKPIKENLYDYKICLDDFKFSKLYSNYNNVTNICNLKQLKIKYITGSTTNNFLHQTYKISNIEKLNLIKSKSFILHFNNTISINIMFKTKDIHYKAEQYDNIIELYDINILETFLNEFKNKIKNIFKTNQSLQFLENYKFKFIDNIINSENNDKKYILIHNDYICKNYKNIIKYDKIMLTYNFTSLVIKRINKIELIVDYRYKLTYSLI